VCYSALVEEDYHSYLRVLRAATRRSSVSFFECAL
jgi:hypothetical protein